MSHCSHVTSVCLFVFTGRLLWAVCYQRLASFHALNLKDIFTSLFQTSPAEYNSVMFVLQVKKTFWSNKLTVWILTT